MKTTPILVALLLAFSAVPGRLHSQRAAAPVPESERALHEGDLVFQESRSPQAAAIREVTGSRYTHVGLAFRRDGVWQVLEAIGPVRYTPYADWIARGQGGRVSVRRLRDADVRLDPDAIARLRSAAEAHLGRPYDARFEPSDDAIYCSELVWKAYDRALGVRIGEPQPWSDFNLRGPRASELVQGRLRGRHPIGLVITPVRMLDSSRVVSVPTP